jgi:hypothetical protein
MLAAFEDLHRHHEMRGGDSEVEHDLDVLASEEILDSQRRQPELVPAGPGTCVIEVGDRMHVKIGEPGDVLQVVPADHAGPDDTDPHPVGTHRSTSRR